MLLIVLTSFIEAKPKGNPEKDESSDPNSIDRSGKEDDGDDEDNGLEKTKLDGRKTMLKRRVEDDDDDDDDEDDDDDSDDDINNDDDDDNNDDDDDDDVDKEKKKKGSKKSPKRKGSKGKDEDSDSSETENHDKLWFACDDSRDGNFFQIFILQFLYLDSICTCSDKKLNCSKGALDGNPLQSANIKVKKSSFTAETVTAIGNHIRHLYKVNL